MAHMKHHSFAVERDRLHPGAHWACRELEPRIVDCWSCGVPIPEDDADADGDCPECRTRAFEIENAANFRAED